MTLDDIQELWEKGSVIDADNLHLESLKIPQLHSKYYKIYNEILLLRKRNLQKYNEVKKNRYEYYNGKAEPEVYVDEPFPFKIRDKETMGRYLDADEKLGHIRLKNEYYDTMLKYLEDILKIITNRTYQIKNSIDFLRFQSGM